MKKSFEDIMLKLKQTIKDQGSMLSLTEALNLNASTVSRWFAEGRSPDFRMLVLIFNHLGIRIVFPNEPENGDSSLIKENKELKGEVKELQGKVEELKDYKTKWEGHIEALQAAASAKERTRIQEAELEKFSAPPLEHYSEEVKL